MTWRLDSRLEEALWAAARGRLPPAALSGTALRAAIVERTLRYTSERSRLHETLAGNPAAADLAARALFFTVADAAKVLIPLTELDRVGLLGEHQLRVLDLGAGAGAMTLGLADFLARRGQQSRLDATLVDVDRSALELAADAVAAFVPDARIRVNAADVAAIELQGSFDLVLMGTVLNELPAAAQLPLVEKAIRALAPGGSLVVIEPALRETTRALHLLRDQLLMDDRAQVFAPCTRTVAPCPALADEADWCHEDRAVELPPRARQLAQATGLRTGGMKFSYLVLRQTPAAQMPHLQHQPLRVVSAPLKSKGKHELYVCSDQGRQLVRLLRRRRSTDNRAFERARRGDLLITQSPLAEQIDADTVLKLRHLSGDD